MELPKNPVVLVLLVATDGAAWLPDAIRGLRAQRYERTDVIAVDNASEDGSGDLLADAFGARRVIVLERRAGYGRALASALKFAAEQELEADAFLLLHDDAELAPGSIEALVDAMASTGAGIVGAKLVEWNDASVLQDIGQTCDRYGRGVPRVERGELDQGQHDGVHDVLYATSAAMLVAREVVETVGLFDMRYVAMRDDLDLCWRARLAGYKTMITSGAVARHASAFARGLRSGPIARRTRYFSDRNMIATLIKNYGMARLLLTVPLTLGVSLVNVLLFLLTGKRGAALQTLEALQWNFVHLPSTLRWRLRAQRTRKARDSEVTSLMHHGATRLRAQFERAVERVVGEVDEGTDEETPAAPPGMVERLRRHPTATMMLLAAIVGFLGARAMFFSGPMAGADLAPFPSHAGSFFTEFLSGWRGTGSGGAAPSTPGLTLLGAFSFLCFGSTWLAERLLVLGLPVVGAVLMFRLARAIGLDSGARRLATVAYLVSPLVLGSLGEGRFGDLVLLAAAPGLVLAALRATGRLPGSWRSLGAGVVGLAATASLAPWALPFTAGAIVILAAGANSLPRAQIVRRAALIVGGALALLFPWTIELFRRGSPLGAGGSSEPTTMRALLGLSPGIHPVPEVLWYGLAAAAVSVFFLPRAARHGSARTLSRLAVGGIAVAWVVARGVPWIAPRPALPLMLAAVAIPLLAGAAFQGAGPLLSRRQVGLAHIMAGIVGVLVVVQVGAGAVWVASGSRPGVAHADELLPAFLASDAAREGEFRIAWVGGSGEAPVVALSDPSGATMRSYLTRATGAGQDELRGAVGAIVGGGTSSGGRLLGTLGVKYVVLRPNVAAKIRDGFARQVDLGCLYFCDVPGRATLWVNHAGLPVAVAALNARAGGTEGAALLGGAATRGLGLRRTGSSSYAGKVQKGITAILLAEDFSSKWRSDVAGSSKKPRRSFGWATAFPARAGTAEISWRGNLWHRMMLALEVLIIFVFIGEWSRRAARERGER